MGSDRPRSCALPAIAMLPPQAGTGATAAPVASHVVLAARALNMSGCSACRGRARHSRPLRVVPSLEPGMANGRSPCCVTSHVASWRTPSGVHDHGPRMVLRCWRSRSWSFVLVIDRVRVRRRRRPGGPGRRAAQERGATLTRTARSLPSKRRDYPTPLPSRPARAGIEPSGSTNANPSGASGRRGFWFRTRLARRRVRPASEGRDPAAMAFSCRTRRRHSDSAEARRWTRERRQNRRSHGV